MGVPDSDSRFSDGEELRRRAAAARAQARVLVEAAQQLRRQYEQAAARDFRAEQLQHSALARLRARMETMPIIEQAKGIIMAQSACDPAEAFDLLRRASQRSNVPVRELAAAIVSGRARPQPEVSRPPAPSSHRRMTRSGATR